jgi:glutamyl-tRNA reductase
LEPKIVIVVVGLSHHTAPIEVREQIALSKEAAEQVLKALLGAPGVAEAMVVSTCNRVEVVAVANDENGQALIRVAEGLLIDRAPGIAPHLYRHQGSDATRHLFRVAASLDSLVLGEPQILGQVKDALRVGRSAGSVGTTLNRVVTHAIRTAKRVRTETTLGSGQVSVPSVAIDLAQRIFDPLEGHTVVLIGSGEMGEAVARLLAQAGSRLLVVGRNEARVTELATKMGGIPRHLNELEQTLIEADVVVTTTSAPGFVISKEMVTAAQKKRWGRSLFLIDLAVPRDVEPSVAKLENVFLYNVDDFAQIVGETATQRNREAVSAQAIIEAEVTRFERAVSAEQVTPTVVALRSTFRAVLDAELDRSLRGRLKHLPSEDREALGKMFEAVLNKLFHRPTRRLRQLAADSTSAAELEGYVEALEDLFSLSKEEIEANDEAPRLSSPSNELPSGVDAVSPEAPIKEPSFTPREPRREAR